MGISMIWYREQRALVMEFMYRCNGIDQGEIGSQMGGMDYPAVRRERKRLREKMELDPNLNRWVKAIEKRLTS